MSGQKKMKMRNILQKSISVLSAVLIFLSCTKNIKSGKDYLYNNLSGEWTSREEFNEGKSQLLYMLKLKQDGVFDWKITVYEGNNSFSHLYKGTFLVNQDNISFQANEHQSWESFDTAQRKVEKISQTLFDSCTYKINGNFLKLDYITYPADGPILTQAVYTRLR